MDSEQNYLKSWLLSLDEWVSISCDTYVNGHKTLKYGSTVLINSRAFKHLKPPSNRYSTTSSIYDNQVV